MEQGATRNYVFYAIGEIGLVVLGILIALQINNWNEERKDLAEERSLIQNLHVEFQANISSLHDVSILLEQSTHAMSTLLNIMDKSSPTSYTTNQLDSLIYQCIANPPWTRSEYTLRDLEGSGRLRQLTDDSLKVALYEWTRLNEEIVLRENQATTSYNDLLRFLKRHAALRQLDRFGLLEEGPSIIKKDNVHLLSNLEFENAVDDFLIYTRQRLIRYQRAERMLEEIMTLSSD